MKLSRVIPVGVTIVAFFVSASLVSAATMAAYSKAVTKWNPTAGASSYNIYFKEAKAKSYNHAVVQLPSSSTSYTVSYLKRGVTYKYKVSAVDWSGKEFWWSNEKWMTNYQNQ